MSVHPNSPLSIPALTDTMRTYRAYLGGSFNPIHLGHIAMALAVKTRLQSLSCRCVVSLMPSNNPLKTDTRHAISHYHRLAMLKRVCDEQPLAIENYELSQNPNKPSYTIDTLRALKTHHPHDTLIFIIGQDSLESLPTWKEGITILDHAHLWAFHRHPTPSIHCPHAQQHNASAQLQARLTDNISDIIAYSHGYIYQDATTIDAISSTLIRQNIMTNKPIDKLTLPSIATYITNHSLYR